jgi:hypothetical protein
MAKEHFNTLHSSDVNVGQEFDVSRLKARSALVLFRYVRRFITPGCGLAGAAAYDECMYILYNIYSTYNTCIISWLHEI